MSTDSFHTNTITQTKRREQWSGKGKSFSQWFDITSDPPPAEYLLKSAEFHLEGDRRCGSWAECREVINTGTQVTWQFRMQGHEEGPKDAISAGVLTTTYFKPVPAEDSYTSIVKGPPRFSGSKGSFGCFEHIYPAGARDVWCEISAVPPHPGFSIEHVSFKLTGDRQVEGDDEHRNVRGSYASCLESERTDMSAVWKYQMQGHSEVSGSGAELSRAELTVTYKRSVGL